MSRRYIYIYIDHIKYNNIYLQIFFRKGCPKKNSGIKELSLWH